MSKLLVIDDSIIVYKMIKRVIEPSGYEIVAHAKNGEEGLEFIEAYRPDFITLDLAMPVMDGFEVCRALSENKPSLLPRIIILSSTGDEDVVVELSSLGLHHFLKKPINADEMLNLLNQLKKTIPTTKI